MNSGLWLLLCMLLSSWPFFFFAIGFLLYFQVREPLPFACPRWLYHGRRAIQLRPNCKAHPVSSSLS